MKTQATKQKANVTAVQQPTTFHQKDDTKKRNLRRFLIPTVMALVLSLSAFGAEADVGPVTVQTLAIIATATGGHQAGDVEVGVLGLVIPPGFTCTDSHYLTTKKSTDPDRTMFNLLLRAKTTQPFSGEPERIYLRITDNPSLTAFPGRCSVEIVRVL